MVELDRLKNIDDIRGEDSKETEQLLELYLCSVEYIQSFQWNEGITCAKFGTGIADIIAVFLFSFTPSREGIDRILWVVVGDIPPAYLLTDDAPDPISALEIYVWGMRQWVDAVKSGRSVTDLVPVNVSPSLENAIDLQRRLDMLESTIIPQCRVRYFDETA